MFGLPDGIWYIWSLISLWGMVMWLVSEIEPRYIEHRLAMRPLRRMAGRWYDYLLHPPKRARYHRIGWTLVPVVSGGLRGFGLLDVFGGIGRFEGAAQQPNTMVTNLLFNDSFEGTAVSPTLLDSRTIVQSNDFETASATTDYGHSLGTETLQSLAAWAQDNGVSTIAASIVTVPIGGRIRTGHTDMGNGVVWQERFVFQTGSNPGVIWCYANGAAWNGNLAVYHPGGSSLDTFVVTNGAGTAKGSSAMTLVNGTAYWFQITITATGATIKVFNDNAGAINTGSQVGTTITFADTTYPTGQIGLYNDPAATAAAQFGGAFSNVCYATGPCPTGCASQPSGASWNTGKEPWFCWSNKAAYYGTHSLSTYFPVSGGSGVWVLPSVAISGTQQWNVWYKSANATALIADNNVTNIATGVAQAAFTAMGGSYTRTATVNMAVGGTASIAGGLQYFDYATIINPATPTGVLFRSLGTDATGTLNAWVNGGQATTWSINGNVATTTANDGGRIEAGHQDWWDSTIFVRCMPVGASGSPGAMLRVNPSTDTGYMAQFSALGALQVYNATGINAFSLLGQNTGLTITAGSWYWLKFSATGTSLTASLYQDAAGFVGDLVSTVNVTDATYTVGRMALRNGNAFVNQFGGPYSNVCIVQGALPTQSGGGATWNPFNLNWTTAEPAFCWSKNGPYYGTYVFSGYQAYDPGTSSFWRWYNGNRLACTAGHSYVIGAALKTVATTQISALQVDWYSAGGYIATAQAASVAPGNNGWASYSGTLTAPAGAIGFYIYPQTNGGTGTLYADNITVVDAATPYSTQPNNVVFQSIGTAGAWTPTGDLSAWVTQGTTAIASHVVTLPNPSSIARGGHADWTAITITARVQASSASASDLCVRYKDSSNYGEVQLNAGSNDFRVAQIVGGVYSQISVTNPATPLRAGAWYWIVATLSGQTFTANLYNDLNGYLGITQMANQVSGSLDASLTAGPVQLQQEGSVTGTWGGAFPNVFTVQSPWATGWVPPIQNNGEGAWCWDSTKSAMGAHSLSFYSKPGSGGASGYVETNNLPAITGGQTYTMVGDMDASQISAGWASLAFYEHPSGTRDAVQVSGTGSGTSWQQQSVTAATASATTSAQMLIDISGNFEGTVWWDDLYLVQSSTAAGAPGVQIDDNQQSFIDKQGIIYPNPKTLQTAGVAGRFRSKRMKADAKAGWAFEIRGQFWDNPVARMYWRDFKAALLNQVGVKFDPGDGTEFRYVEVEDVAETRIGGRFVGEDGNAEGHAYTAKVVSYEPYSHVKFPLLQRVLAAVTNGNGTFNTNFTVANYAGTRLGEPTFQFTLVIPAGVTVTSVQLQNTTRGESITVPVSLTNGTYYVIIDASGTAPGNTDYGLLAVASPGYGASVSGTANDFTGNPPQLSPAQGVPPKAVSQSFTATITANGALTSAVLDMLAPDRFTR